MFLVYSTDRSQRAAEFRVQSESCELGSVSASLEAGSGVGGVGSVSGPGQLDLDDRSRSQRLGAAGP